MEPDPNQSVTSHLAKDIVLANKKGASILVIDLAPGGESQMHQTASIDFSICVCGDIDMELDGGEMIHLKPGVSQETVMWSYFDIFPGSRHSTRDDAQVVQRQQDRAGKIPRCYVALRTIRDRW